MVIASHYERGLLLYSQRRDVLAEKEFRKYLAHAPQDSAGHAMLSSTLYAQRRYELSLVEAKRAVELDPNAPHSLCVLSYAQLALGNAQEAEEAIKGALQLDQDAQYFAQAAEIAKYKEDWTTVMRFAEDALRIDPENLDAFKLKAEALARLGDHDQADHWLSLGLQVDPMEAEIHFDKAFLCLRDWRMSEAIVHLNEALRLDPNTNWFCHHVIKSVDGQDPVCRFLLSGARKFESAQDHFPRWIVIPLMSMFQLLFFGLLIFRIAVSPQGRGKIIRRAKKNLPSFNFLRERSEF